MKKFFTSVPFQKNLSEVIYRPVGNAKLVYEKPHALPILNVINNYIILQISKKVKIF